MKKLSLSLRTLLPAVLLLSLLAACTTSATPTDAPTAIPTEAPAAVAPTTLPAESTATTASVVQPTDAVSEAPAAVENNRLNLNTASGDDFLAAIPGFSSRMVREFLEYRPYISIQQFRKEIGKYVDEAQVAEYELYVYVPVSVDDSDAASLMQIPGLDEATANALIAARPFGSNEAFLAKLAEIAPGVIPGVALGYLD